MIYRMYKQAIDTFRQNKCSHGDVIQPFNFKVVTGGVCPTLTTRPEGLKTANIVVVEENKMLRIRKLVPAECFILMGFTKEDADRLSAAGISNTQLYKMAGNSIVVPVLEGIFKELYKNEY